MSIFGDIAKLAYEEEGKPFGVTIVAVSWTNGVPDNKILYTEGATFPEEYVDKQQAIWDAVLWSLNGDNESGSGGVIRQMGEEFQQIVAESGGDMEQAVAKAKEKWAKGGQGMKREQKVRGPK